MNYLYPNLMANFPAMSIRHPVAVFICMAMAVALLWSKALLAISAGALAIIASTDIQIRPFRIRWLLTPTQVMESIRTRPWMWVYALFFLLYLVSGLYPGSLQQWWSLTHVKIVFLILPLSFALLDPFSKRDYMIVVLCMVLMAVWSSVWVQVAYFEDYYLFNRSLGFGAALPAPTNHIRYSIIIAMSMVICLAFAIEDIRYKYKWERWVYGIIAVYLFYFLHLLSVRSGMMLGYLGIITLVMFYFKRINRVKQVLILLLLGVAPFVAYTWLPGFQQKIHYALYDLDRFREDPSVNYSDAGRWRSYKAGLDIGNRYPFLGPGPGRIRHELQTYYQEQYQLETYNRPHNQFVTVFAIFGLFGLALFLFVVLYPMTIASFWKPALIPVLYIMQLLAMMVEHSVDTAVGTSLFLLLTLMGMSYQLHLRNGSPTEGHTEKTLHA